MIYKIKIRKFFVINNEILEMKFNKKKKNDYNPA